VELLFPFEDEFEIHPQIRLLERLHRSQVHVSLGDIAGPLTCYDVNFSGFVVPFRLSRVKFQAESYEPA
jgi:hypothetical protein